jgi:hypothetical protein
MASGACQYPANTTTCAATSCSGSTLTTYTTCDAAGHCSGGGMTSTCPANLTCNGQGSACRAGCGGNNAQGDGNCTMGDWCDGVAFGVCQAPQASGAGSPCNRGTQCQSGNCTGNHCG